MSPVDLVFEFGPCDLTRALAYASAGLVCSTQTRQSKNVMYLLRAVHQRPSKTIIHLVAMCDFRRDNDGGPGCDPYDFDRDDGKSKRVALANALFVNFGDCLHHTACYEDGVDH